MTNDGTIRSRHHNETIVADERNAHRSRLEVRRLIQAQDRGLRVRHIGAPSLRWAQCPET